MENQSIDQKNEDASLSANELSDESDVIHSDKQDKQKRLSKTEKKFNRYQRKLANYKVKKLEKKKLKQSQLEAIKNINGANKDNNNVANNEESESKTEIVSYDTYINKRELKKMAIERMTNVIEKNGLDSLKICIDCSFSDLMSDKELSRLAQQIGRCYASNKSLNKPVYLTLCNLNTDSKFYKECCRVNDGFAKYILKTSDKSIENLYSDSLDSVAYLSPDSTTYLESLDVDTTYVIGGLVDETVTKKVTINKCNQLKINTFALPIEKYMTRKVFLNGEIDPKTYNYNKILAINQVFDILANFFITNDWNKSLEIGVPKRKGFIIDTNKTEIINSASD